MKRALGLSVVDGGRIALVVVVVGEEEGQRTQAGANVAPHRRRKYWIEDTRLPFPRFN